jgi:hypothetical protein
MSLCIYSVQNSFHCTLLKYVPVVERFICITISFSSFSGHFILFLLRLCIAEDACGCTFVLKHELTTFFFLNFHFTISFHTQAETTFPTRCLQR